MESRWNDQESMGECKVLHSQQDVQSLNQWSVRGRMKVMKNSPGEDWEAAGAVSA